MRMHPSAWPSLISALAAIAIYALTLLGTFVYDDIAVVHDDPRVRQPHRWVELWTKPYFENGVDNLYRPLVSSSYALQWHLHFSRPWTFHAVNILLHALVCALVAEFTRRCLARSGLSESPLGPSSDDTQSARASALCAGLLFAVHPLHVEAVASIVGRAELACAAAIFAGLVILAKRPLSTWRVFAALLSAIVALLCKEQAILQPLLWFLFLWLIWPQLPRGHNTREPAAVKLLILLICWTWTGYMICREHYLKFEWDRTLLSPTVQPMLHSAGLDRMLMPVVLLGRYTALLLWPMHLSPDYSGDVIGSVAHRGDPYLWLGFAALAGWSVATASAVVTRHRVALFCLVSLAITYSVIGNILTLIGTIFADRLAYLPSAFFLILVALPISKLPGKLRTAVMVLLLMLGSTRTITAAAEWNNPMKLFVNSLATHPKSIQLRFLIAQEYHVHGNEPGAEAALREAARMYPDNWQVWMRCASQAMDAGQLDKAQTYLDRAKKLEANPNLLEVQDRLARLKASRGH